MFVFSFAPNAWMRILFIYIITHPPKKRNPKNTYNRMP